MPVHVRVRVCVCLLFLFFVFFLLIVFWLSAERYARVKWFLSDYQQATVFAVCRQRVCDSSIWVTLTYRSLPFRTYYM